MEYVCEIKEQDARPTLSIRTRTAVQDLPRALEQSYGTIMGYMNELGEQPAGPPFVAYYNMDMADLDIEVGLPVARTLPGQAEIQAGAIPGGPAATCLHTGPYDKLEPAYTALTKWVEQHNHIVSGVAYEFYLNDPDETAPEELQTLIVFPLQR